MWFNTGYPQMTAHGFDAAGSLGCTNSRLNVGLISRTGRTLGVAIYAGEFYRGDSYFVGYFDVKGTPDKPTVIEFEAQMRKRDTFRMIPYNVKAWEVGNGRNRIPQKEYTGMGLAVRTLERIGPLEAWPPVSHKKLFGKLAFEQVDEGWPGGQAAEVADLWCEVE